MSEHCTICVVVLFDYLSKNRQRIQWYVLYICQQSDFVTISLWNKLQSAFRIILSSFASWKRKTTLGTDNYVKIHCHPNFSCVNPITKHLVFFHNMICFSPPTGVFGIRITWRIRAITHRPSFARVSAVWRDSCNLSACIKWRLIKSWGDIFKILMNLFKSIVGIEWQTSISETNERNAIKKQFVG